MTDAAPAMEKLPKTWMFVPINAKALATLLNPKPLVGPAAFHAAPSHSATNGLVTAPAISKTPPANTLPLKGRTASTRGNEPPPTPEPKAIQLVGVKAAIRFAGLLLLPIAVNSPPT